MSPASWESWSCLSAEPTRMRANALRQMSLAGLEQSAALAAFAAACVNDRRSDARAPATLRRRVLGAPSSQSRGEGLSDGRSSCAPVTPAASGDLFLGNRRRVRSSSSAWLPPERSPPRGPSRGCRRARGRRLDARLGAGSRATPRWSAMSWPSLLSPFSVAVRCHHALSALPSIQATAFAARLIPRFTAPNIAQFGNQQMLGLSLFLLAGSRPSLSTMAGCTCSRPPLSAVASLLVGLGSQLGRSRRRPADVACSAGFARVSPEWRRRGNSLQWLSLLLPVHALDDGLRNGFWLSTGLSVCSAGSGYEGSGWVYALTSMAIWRS